MPFSSHALMRLANSVVSPSSPSPGAVNGFAPGVCARESVAASEGAVESPSPSPPILLGAGGANEKAGRAAGAAGAEADAAGAAEPKEKPKVAFAGWSFSDRVAAGAPAEDPLPPGLPIDEPKPKPALRFEADLLASPPCRAAPNPKEAGGDPAGPPDVAEGDEGLAAPNEIAGVELAADPKLNGDGLGVAEEAAPKEKPVDGVEEAVELEAPKENGEPLLPPPEDAAPNVNDGGAVDVGASGLVPAGFFSVSPLAIPPNVAPNEKPDLDFVTAGAADSSGFSGLVGGLALWPNRSGDGLAGGFVSLAGASLGADGAFSSSRLEEGLGFAGAASAAAGAEDVEPLAVPAPVPLAGVAAGGNEKALFWVDASFAAESALKTKPPETGAEEADGADLTALPANENMAGGAGGCFDSSFSSVRSAIGTGFGGLRKIAGISLSSTVGAIAGLDDEVEDGVDDGASAVSDRSAMGTGFGGLRKMAGISLSETVGANVLGGAVAGVEPWSPVSDKSAMGTGLGGFRKISGISKAGAAAGAVAGAVFSTSMSLGVPLLAS